VDEGEAVRRLGVDRDTVLAFVQAGRLRAYPGVGKGSFFKLADLDALAVELHPAVPMEPAQAVETTEEGAAPKRPQHDPAYKVHLRLQADLKWYDLTEDDLRLWIRELRPDAYERQRTNIEHVVERLRRLLSLMEEAAAGWRSVDRLASPTPPSAPRG
jgi:hypothetical protein